jgi:protease IV
MNTIKNAIKWLLKTVFTVLIVFAVMLFFASAFIAKMSIEGMNKNEVKRGTYLSLSLPEELTESPSDQLFFTGFKPKDLNRKVLILSSVLSGISDAAADPRISGIIIDLDNWAAAPEHTGEIAGSLEKFRSSGKEVIAFGSSLDKNSYLAALAADQIILDPSSSVTIILNAFGASVPYFKDMGDNIGVKVNVIHIGQYKGAGENFARNSMSPQFRESIEKILDDRTDLFLSAVSENRKIPREDLDKMLSEGELVFITPEKALEIKLVDRLMSFDDLKKEKDLTEKLILNFADYSLNETGKTEEKVAVILAEGNIIDGADGSAVSDGTINPDSFEKIVSKVKKDKNIKAVVLRVNSPGGSALASEKILRKIIGLKNDMPVIVSMGPVAASGGYYISCAATKIFAEPHTVTGSIGVVSMMPDLKGLTDKLGIKNERLSKGKYSDIFDFTKGEYADDIELMKRSMQNIYDEFKGRVSTGRNIAPADLENIAQGQIWTGRQAKELGLVDEIGGLEQAISEAAALSGLEKYGVVYFPENKTFAEKIFSIEMEQPDVLDIFGGSKLLRNESELIKRSIMFAGKPSLIMPVRFE